MKGIICAGGNGTRLAPLTKDTNKHLLPVYKKLMVEYPLQTLTSAGIEDVILITGGKKPGSFLEYLEDGSPYGLNTLYYTHQGNCHGIPAALKTARKFVEDEEPCVMILGDNYFEDGMEQYLLRWNKKGAMCILKETKKPWDFGIAEVKNERIVSLEEKPKNPKSNLAVTGCYFFDYQVWDFIDNLKPSIRGEFEITDILNQYLEKESLYYSVYNGYWLDMGTFESWTEVSLRIALKDQK